MKYPVVFVFIASVVIVSGCCNGRKPVTNTNEVTSDFATVTIQASNGKFVSVDMNRGDTLVADRDKAASWEMLGMETLDNGLTCFRAHQGKLVCSDGGDILVANRDAAGEWESFKVNQLPDGLYTIQNYKNQYLSLRSDNIVIADKTEAGETEKFRITKQ